jgi:hypothetical protein
LYQEGVVISRAGEIEYPVRGSACEHVSIGTGRETANTNLSSEATSIIRGMSREKPALDLVRYME